MNNQAGAGAPARPGPTGPLVAATGGAAAGIPSYALATPAQHAGETRALLSLIFGIAGLAGALFMAVIALALGITGIVLGTMSRSSAKRGLSTAGLIFSSLAILAGLAVWVYAIRHDSRLNPGAGSAGDHSISAPAVSASDLSTPCYSIGFADKLNITNDPDSCDMNAFNGATLDTSTDAYKVLADTSQVVNAQNYASIFKTALEKDVRTTLPGFTIDSQRATQFAGSPAYVVNASSPSQGVAVVETIVLHQVDTGNNVFVLVHAVNGSKADLNTLESQWRWK